MHIGHILITSFSTYPSFSRQGKVLHNIINALGPRFVADVLTIRENIMGYVEKVHNNRILRVPVSGNYMERISGFQRAIIRQLDGDEYDLIHFRSPWEGKVFADKYDYLDSKFIYEPALSLPADVSDDIKNMFIEYEKLSMTLADVVLLPHKIDPNSISFTPENTYFAEFPQGVDINLFDWEDTTGLIEFDLIWVDNFSSLGPIDTVLSALKEVKKSRPKIMLAMAGPMNDTTAEYTLKKIKQFDLKNNVRFFGTHPEDELSLLISRAKTAIVAPRFVTPGIFPRDISMNLIEYMACGVPVVAPISAYVKEITDNGNLAILYNPVDFISLSKALVKSLEQRDLVSHQSLNAYKKVRNTYTAANSRRNLIRVYANLTQPVLRDEKIEFGKGNRKSAITWTGNYTSNTGPGLPYPVSDDSVPRPDDYYETDTLNIELEEIEEIEFEAQGTMLGIHDSLIYDDSTDSPTDPFQTTE